MPYQLKLVEKARWGKVALWRKCWGTRTEKNKGLTIENTKICYIYNDLPHFYSVRVQRTLSGWITGKQPKYLLKEMESDRRERESTRRWQEYHTDYFQKYLSIECHFLLRIIGNISDFNLNSRYLTWVKTILPESVEDKGKAEQAIN